MGRQLHVHDLNLTYEGFLFLRTLPLQLLFVIALLSLLPILYENIKIKK